MNDNIGDMPIEIFGDYVSDCLDIDFPWEYLALVYNGQDTVVKYGSHSGSGGHLYSFLKLRPINHIAKGMGDYLCHKDYNFHYHGGGYFKDKGRGYFSELREGYFGHGYSNNGY